MARTYSQDLRDRVIDAAFFGASARQTAARFGIGEATAIVWVRRAREPGDRSARKQGQPRRSKLDPHRGYLLGLIAETPDLTISELLERLLAERSVRASRATLWTFLDRCGLAISHIDAFVAGVSKHLQDAPLGLKLPHWIAQSTAAELLQINVAFFSRLANTQPDLLPQRGPGYTPYLASDVQALVAKYIFVPEIARRADMHPGASFPGFAPSA
jgi:transposase